MQPQELLEIMADIQTTANVLTISTMALSESIGQYIEYLTYGAVEEDKQDPVKVMTGCMTGCNDAMIAFCNAMVALAKKLEDTANE